jgi:hypothetical protein
MGFEQQIGLLRAVLQRKGGGHAERVEGMDVAARRQHLGRADQVAARHRFDIAPDSARISAGQFRLLAQKLARSGRGSRHRSRP